MSDEQHGVRRSVPARAAYPRPGEPVVPHLLRFLAPETRELGRAAPDDDRVRQVAALLVGHAQRRLRTLPDHVLAFPLPDPATALASLPLERRTASTLRPLAASEGPIAPWTVARYLAIPRFGGRALVDLLASFEARAASDGGAAALLGEPPPAAFSAPPLDEALTRISWSLPLSEAQVNGELVRLRVLDRPTSLSRVARAATRLGWTPTFRVVDIGGTRMAVARSQVTTAANAYAIASRTVYDWGAATVSAVLDQLRVVASATVGAGFVRAILGSMKDFQWLDQQRAWFWFRARPSRLLQNIRKVFSVVPELAVTRLRDALARTENGTHLPPPAVLLQICAELPGTFVTGAFVGIDRLLDRAVYLGKAERRVVEWLEARKRGVRLGELGDLCQDLSLSRWTVRRVLESSPLVEALPGRSFGLVTA